MVRSNVCGTLAALLCLFAACTAPGAAEIAAAEIGAQPDIEQAKACAKELISAQMYDDVSAVYTWPEQTVRGWYKTPVSEPKFGWELSVRVNGTNLNPPHTHNHLYVVFFRDGAAVALGAPSYDTYGAYKGTTYSELSPPVPIVPAAKVAR